MAKAVVAKQISFTMPNRVGLLGEVTAAMANAGINIKAVCAYQMEGKAFFMLVSDDNVNAKKQLSKMKVKTEQDDIVIVELINKVGSLHRMAEIISEAGIDINYLYATAGSGKTSNCVFSCSNNKKALKVLNG